MNSLGIKSFYMHPVDALHGDLGQINQNDFILFISKSGETQEIITLMHHLKQMGNLLFSITMGLESTVCKMSDYNYKVPLVDEACHINLVPTTSMAVFLVIGDIISIIVSQNKGFTQAHFKKTHPGGDIGEKLNYV